YYLTKEYANGLYYALYNFNTMNHNTKAYKDLMNSEFSFLGLSEVPEEKNDRYSLVLDFLNNTKKPYLSIINQIKDYFTNENFIPVSSENPLRLKIDNLNIDDIINMIQDDKFQTINAIIATTNSTVWKLYRN